MTTQAKAVRSVLERLDRRAAYAHHFAVATQDQYGPEHPHSIRANDDADDWLTAWEAIDRIAAREKASAR